MAAEDEIIAQIRDLRERRVYNVPQLIERYGRQLVNKALFKSLVKVSDYRKKKSDTVAPVMTEEIKQEMWELRQQGMTIKAIAEKYDRAYVTVAGLLQRLAKKKAKTNGS